MPSCQEHEVDCSTVRRRSLVSLPMTDSTVGDLVPGIPTALDDIGHPAGATIAPWTVGSPMKSAGNRKPGSDM